MLTQTGLHVVHPRGNVVCKQAHLVETLVHKPTQVHLVVLNGGLVLDSATAIDKQLCQQVLH